MSSSNARTNNIKRLRRFVICAQVLVGGAVLAIGEKASTAEPGHYRITPHIGAVTQAVRRETIHAKIPTGESVDAIGSDGKALAQGTTNKQGNCRLKFSNPSSVSYRIEVEATSVDLLHESPRASVADLTAEIPYRYQTKDELSGADAVVQQDIYSCTTLLISSTLTMRRVTNTSAFIPGRQWLGRRDWQHNHEHPGDRKHEPVKSHYGIANY